MIRKIGLTIVLAVMAAMLSAVSAQALPYTELALLDSYIEVGESFDVNVVGVADGLTGDPDYDEWLGFAFQVFTPATPLFSWDGYTVGSAFDDDTGFFPPGLGYVAGSAFPGAVDESLVLATLHFTALSEGTGNLTVFGSSGVDQGMGFWFNGFYDISKYTAITVNAASTAVPEPATMLLLGTGLIGLAARRRRIKA